MKRLPLIVPTALATAVLMVLTIVLIRSTTAPGCSARVGEICVVSEGMRFEGVQRSARIESERYVLTFRDRSGDAHDLVVVRDESLGSLEAGPEFKAGASRVETRMWNGSRSSTYVIGEQGPGLSASICVESWLWRQCARSGTLTRLTPYRG